MSSHKEKPTYVGNHAIYRCLKCQERWTKQDVPHCPKCETKFWNTVIMVTQQEYEKFRRTESEEKP